MMHQHAGSRGWLEAKEPRRSAIPQPSSQPSLPSKTPEGLSETLRRLRVFHALDARERLAIARFTTLREVFQREVLFNQGDACACVFGLLEGSVNLVRGRHEQEAVMDLLEPGDLFGETALFTGTGHESTAISLTQCRLLSIAALPLLRHLQQSPRVAHALMSHMSGRIDKLLDRVERHARYCAEQTVAAFLLDRCDEHGILSDAAAGCGRKTLGAYLGLRPETLSRALSRFRKEGWLRDCADGRQVVNRVALGAKLPDWR